MLFICFPLYNFWYAKQPPAEFYSYCYQKNWNQGVVQIVEVVVKCFDFIKMCLQGIPGQRHLTDMAFLGNYPQTLQPHAKHMQVVELP